uniref:Reverse transcriptase Ty1/copia-type domain-containing protein n=1 Tax=Cajanus cajan TaxID=3821 RepID=A0A151TWS8_CAJCA|nr:hypothetical protein KK1_010740 [Cajanus cajan]
MDHLNKLSRKELVIGLPKLKFSKDKLCDVCQKGKQVKASFKSQYQISALQDEHWLMAMQEELNQFERNEVWDLVPLPNDYPIIGTKWVFRNKLDESGIIIRNKTRLMAKGYNQEKGIDYDETLFPVARIEATSCLCFKNEF